MPRPFNATCGWMILLLLFVAAGMSTPANAQVRRALLIGIDTYAPPAGKHIAISPDGHSADSRFAPGVSWVNLKGPLVDAASLQVLLQHNFGFKDIRVLTEDDATRTGILAAIDKLIADTQPGDLVVIYYAGHGSRRLDTLSSKNQLDETIVPRDAWAGIEDIRDKELAMRFNRLVYERRAHLTAIFDSCNSGTMARGITETVQRALPYDDRDVASEKKKDPTTIIESDLKKIPQKGDAIILAAAASNESAVEAQYADDSQWHGAFSRALVRVLQSSTQTLSAEDVIAEVSSMLHADRVPFQQPSVEGRVQQSLFGNPIAEHPLRVQVTKIIPAGVTINVGSAAGFDIGTQFTAIESGRDGQKTQIEVKRIEQPLAATARIISGPTAARVGQTFEMSKMTYPQAARLVIFLPKAESDSAATVGNAKTRFPGLAWVADPTQRPIDFLVVDEDEGLVAYDQTGRRVESGAAAQGSAFLLRGPPAAMAAAVEASGPFQRGAFRFTKVLSEADYWLATRQGSGGNEYALFDPIVSAPHAPDAWVHSPENDPDDTALSGGTQPEVVCRHDVSLPVRTAWLPNDPQADSALIRRIVRLGKLRVWLQSPALAPGAAGWPYHPTITQHNSTLPISGVLRPDQPYDVRLVTTAAQRAATAVIPRYVYLFGFDCGANPFLLYPKENLNGDAMIPQPGIHGVYPLSVSLAQESVGTPLGADTIFMMVTGEKLTNPGILVSDGMIERAARGAGNRFDELISDMSDAGTRGPNNIPTDWFVQQIVLPSAP